MHALNKQAIDNWTMKDYAEAYLNYVNNYIDAVGWYSIYMPEWNDGYEYEFFNVCRNMANLMQE